MALGAVLEEDCCDVVRERGSPLGGGTRRKLEREREQERNADARCDA